MCPKKQKQVEKLQPGKKDGGENQNGPSEWSEKGSY